MASTDRVVINTDKAPAAVGPYSQAIKAGNTVYVSGCIGLVPGTKDFSGPDVESQTEQVLKNMGAILEASGSSYSKASCWFKGYSPSGLVRDLGCWGSL